MAPAEGQAASAASGPVTFTYDPHRYRFDVMVPGVVGAIAIPVALVMIASRVLVPIALLVLVVGVYTVFNTFVAKCYPRVVTLSDEALTLESFGRRDVYPIAEIIRMPVRENGQVRSAYIRVNGGGILRGRYFVGCGDMYTPDGERGEALYQFFLDTEARLDPDNIRVRARRAEARKLEDAEKPTAAPTGRRHRRKKRH
ncbi:hypothetical protein B5F33_02090 [Collinsella sp. An2]|nr:hypothetical protein B5F33_02090 [Collinsella sp. An2]